VDASFLRWPVPVVPPRPAGPHCRARPQFDRATWTAAGSVLSAQVIAAMSSGSTATSPPRSIPVGWSSCSCSHVSARARPRRPALLVALDHRQGVVGEVGDIHPPGGCVDCDALRIVADWDGADDGVGGLVDHRDGVGVFIGDRLATTRLLTPASSRRSSYPMTSGTATVRPRRSPASAIYRHTMRPSCRPGNIMPGHLP
jgi:hypothetical protein